MTYYTIAKVFYGSSTVFVQDVCNYKKRLKPII